MNCPNCKGKLEKRAVSVHGARAAALSYQCRACEYFSFDPVSSERVLNELRSPLKIRQKVVKLSADRLGIYFSNDVVRSLGLKKGEFLYVSAQDRKRIVLERE